MRWLVWRRRPATRRWSAPCAGTWKPASPSWAVNSTVGSHGSASGPTGSGGGPPSSQAADDDGVPASIHACSTARSSVGMVPVAGIGRCSSTMRIDASAATASSGCVTAGTRQASTSNNDIGAPNIGCASWQPVQWRSTTSCTSQGSPRPPGIPASPPSDDASLPPLALASPLASEPHTPASQSTSGASSAQAGTTADSTAPNIQAPQRPRSFVTSIIAPRAVRRPCHAEGWRRTQGPPVWFPPPLRSTTLQVGTELDCRRGPGGRGRASPAAARVGASARRRW